MPGIDEESALNTLQKDIFHCIMLRKAGSLYSQPFPGLQSLVNCVRKQAADKEVSHVTYCEIVSEKSDSKATLMGVISRLHAIFVTELNQKYVLVVGVRLSPIHGCFNVLRFGQKATSQRNF